MDQQLKQKQSLEPTFHACAQVFEKPLAHELWQWDGIDRQGKAREILWESRGAQHCGINWFLLFKLSFAITSWGKNRPGKKKFGNWGDRMHLVEMRADVSTLRETRPEKCEVFLCSHPSEILTGSTSFRDSFATSQACRLQGAVEIPWSSFECTELKLILLEEWILD